MRNPFRYYKTSPDVIRLAVMMYIRFPLSLRLIQGVLERLTCRETVDICCTAGVRYRAQSHHSPLGEGCLQ
jgi:transposase-like protein